MPYVLDESSYRIDKNTFPTSDEASDRAAETARILGRAITVYELTGGELHFAFRVMPDGTIDETNPLPENEPVEPASPAVLGRMELLDTIAETLERAGRPDLAAAVDRDAVGDEAVAQEGPEAGIRKMAERLKQEDVGAAKKARIEDDTPIIPELVADTILGSELNGFFYDKPELQAAWEKVYDVKDKMARQLAKRADQTYGANPDFAKKIRARGNKGRDTLYVFMRHWIAAELKKKFPAVYQALPSSFSQGAELR